LIISDRKDQNGFENIQQGKSTLYINRSFSCSELAQALLAGEENFRSKYNLELIPASKFARVYKFNAIINNSGVCLYYKRYLDRSALDFFKHLFRKSRCRRAFEASEMLCENGFLAPVAVVVGSYKTGFLNKDDFVVTLEAENAKKFSQWLPENTQDLTASGLHDERQMFTSFGNTVGQMHAKGIFHGDLRLGNVLAVRDNTAWRFIFLDNERTRRFGRLAGRLRLKNLVQINMCRSDAISNTARARFFKAYLQHNPDITKRRKSWAKIVIKKTNRRLRKKARL